jgi:hypothetical protein
MSHFHLKSRKKLWAVANNLRYVLVHVSAVDTPGTHKENPIGD